jgi:hypothetical protein
MGDFVATASHKIVTLSQARKSVRISEKRVFAPPQEWTTTPKKRFWSCNDNVRAPSHFASSVLFPFPGPSKPFLRGSDENKENNNNRNQRQAVVKCVKFLHPSFGKCQTCRWGWLIALGVVQSPFLSRSEVKEGNSKQTRLYFRRKNASNAREEPTPAWPQEILPSRCLKSQQPPGVQMF